MVSTIISSRNELKTSARTVVDHVRVGVAAIRDGVAWLKDYMIEHANTKIVVTCSSAAVLLNQAAAFMESIASSYSINIADEFVIFLGEVEAFFSVLNDDLGLVSNFLIVRTTELPVLVK